MLLSLSDIILFGTLIVNGAAILNFKLPSTEHSFEEPSDGLKSKLFDLLRNLRLLRVFVALWNVVVLFLMIVMFGA